VMARGNQRNRIFASPDGGDESLFLETPGRMLRTFRFPNLVMGPDGQPLSPPHRDTLGQSVCRKPRHQRCPWEGWCGPPCGCSWNGRKPSSPRRVDRPSDCRRPITGWGRGSLRSDGKCAQNMQCEALTESGRSASKNA
jgi:hypothetical protein